MLHSLFSWIRRFGTRPVLALTVTTALAVVCVLALGLATPVAAQGPCADLMAPTSDLFEIKFTGGMTETLPGPNVAVGQVICVQTNGIFSVGFKSANEFYLNGGHISPSANATNYFDGADVDSFATFLITGGNVDTTFQWAPADMDVINVYVGQLRPSPRQTPPPAAAQPTPPAPWVVVPLPVVYGTDVHGTTAEWHLKPISGTVTLEISSKVQAPVHTPNGVVTPTLSLSGWYEFREVVVEGVYSAPALSARAGYWQARISGAPSAILRMKAAPTPVAAPASTAATGLISVWKRASDGAFVLTANCTGVAVQFDPSKHHLEGTCTGGRGRIAGAPASRPPYLPLILKP